jgi:hypothetical protein
VATDSPGGPEPTPPSGPRHAQTTEQGTAQATEQATAQRTERGTHLRTQKIFRPQYGILLLALLAPYDGLLLIVPHGASLHSWKEVLTLATLVASLVLGRGSGAARSWRNLPGWLPPLAGLIVVGLIWSIFVGFVQAKTGFRIDFFYVLLGFALWRAPLNARERDWLITILMVNGVVTAVVGIAQQVVGTTRLHELGYAYNTAIRNSHGHLRSFSTFGDPFPFAFYLMVVALVALPVALGEPRRLRNRVFLFCLPLLGLGMVLALVRGAWLGLAVGLVYLGLRRHRILLLAVPLGAAGVVVLLLLPGTFGSSALSTTSIQQRFDSWHHNLDHVLRRPMGTGIGSSGAAAAKTASLTGTRAHTFQPDNYYFKEIYELGIPGLLLFLWLLFAAFRNADRKGARIRGPDGALALGVAASVVGVAAASLVSTYLEIFPMDLMFWLLVSVVAFSCPTSPSTA